VSFSYEDKRLAVLNNVQSTHWPVLCATQSMFTWRRQAS